jgi:iron(III) transport system permease protein
LTDIAVAPLQPPPAPQQRWAVPAGGFTLTAAVAALACAIPAAVVLLAAIGALPIPGAAPTSTMSAFATAYFWECVRGTLFMVAVAGVGSTVLGTVTAWLISMCAFPGRGFFGWALVLPLAAPAYVLAYAYAGLTWAGGIVPIGLSGLWGTAFVYTIAFYPYTYLSARAAFTSQSVCALEAGRTLGTKPLALIWTIALPMAWPGIAAGAALATMEIAADYGAAQHFGAQTLSTGVFRAWYARGEPQAALQLAGLLLIGAFVLLTVERTLRGRRGFAGGSSRWRPLPRYQLEKGPALAATVFCALIVGLGAVAPFGWLLDKGLFRPTGDLSALLTPLRNSLLLAFAASLATLPLAAAIAAGARQTTPLARKAGSAALFAAGVGYAAPGAVIALGVLVVFGLLRQAGLVGGMAGGLALALLIWTYAARFAAPGAQPIEAGLSRVATSVGYAARSLGASPLQRFWRVDLPIAAPSVAAATLIVFVEALKELPATLILRPFNFDTLAVKAYQYASDERLAQAAAPCLIIVLAGLIPVIVLSQRLEAGRAGARP